MSTKPIKVQITNAPENVVAIVVTPANDVAKQIRINPGDNATVDLYGVSDIIISDGPYVGSEPVVDDPPTANDDTDETAQNTPVVVDVLANDEDGTNPIDPATVVLMDGEDEVTSLAVTDEGTYTVDEETGEVTFTPDAEFTGDATPVSYKVSSTTGKQSDAATITITVTGA